MDWAAKIPLLLTMAWLLPLASFATILCFGRRLGRGGRGAAWIACAAILGAFVLSAIAAVGWLMLYPQESDNVAHAGQHVASPAQLTQKPADRHHPHEHGPAVDSNSPSGAPHKTSKANTEPLVGVWYSLGCFGGREINLGYYIDGLTIAMFCMVSLVASCIHIYSLGYMHDELEEVVDNTIRLSDGRRLRRPGRFHRFFQHLSLFCFSMLGLILAGNLAMVFCFWELVGICSYLLIGFYIERPSANAAANKAFIVNRVGDFGMIVGVMVFWTGLGTLSFGDLRDAEGKVISPGIFSLMRLTPQEQGPHIPDGLVRLSASDRVASAYRFAPDAAAAEESIQAQLPHLRSAGWGYGLLILGGFGIFCGCVGKSAQFPLHVWLPDAMEGPTPVSALVHSATMVAAGVYLVGRCMPMFAAEVLLLIGIVGCITLLLAATIALTATDIKRVLAYSTVSQLGYMMLALGCGGWIAGMLHLFTHAFFKSLLFLCAGSVIHACQTNELPEMGGLWRKMPWTAGTMLIGCLAIIGAGIPLIVGLSGYYSKDAILAQLYLFSQRNPHLGWMFYAAAIGAALTAFYMFRLWFLAFVGRPRNEHVYHHAHESPPVMIVPLIVLAALAVVGAWKDPFFGLGLETILEQARPAIGELKGVQGSLFVGTVIPEEHLSHQAAIHVAATLTAFLMSACGLLVAAAMFWAKKLDPSEVARQFPRLYRLLLQKWWFDEVYHFLWVRPTLSLARWTAQCDRRIIDTALDRLARAAAAVARFDDWIDRRWVDGSLDRVATAVYNVAIRLRGLQTGYVRQYVMSVVLGVVVLAVMMSMYWNSVGLGR